MRRCGYNILKGVAWSEWPVYVMSKALALSALVLLTIAVVRRARQRTDGRGLLTWSWLFLLMHAALSLMILSAAYYPSYFEGAKLTLSAGLSMLVGAGALAALNKLARTCEAVDSSRWVVALGAVGFAVGVHAGLLGYGGWFQPQKWPGYLVPITLLSFLAGVVCLAAAIRVWRSAR
ncbi:MAG TPA: hypothetical protein PLE19_15680 [Planctomycetota bacterium]|nr:hypothetical protein [Planctomycetota bacterium]HRR79920.1 hypothetical protein [Planctomycetota bacterium]HRT94575.1 hypothetical protein [Planctomycetota bacterium]